MAATFKCLSLAIRTPTRLQNDGQDTTRRCKTDATHTPRPDAHARRDQKIKLCQREFSYHIVARECFVAGSTERSPPLEAPVEGRGDMLKVVKIGDIAWHRRVVFLSLQMSVEIFWYFLLLCFYGAKSNTACLPVELLPCAASAAASGHLESLLPLLGSHVLVKAREEGFAADVFFLQSLQTR